MGLFRYIRWDLEKLWLSHRERRSSGLRWVKATDAAETHDASNSTLDPGKGYPAQNVHNTEIKKAFRLAQLILQGILKELILYYGVDSGYL